MKKIISLILALVMVMGLAVSASAASITIKPPTVPDGATEEGITYKAYKIFDATVNGTAVSYTIESTSLYYDAVNNSGYFELELAAGSTTTYVVTAKDTYTKDVADTFAGTLKAVTGVTEAGTLTKQDDGTYKLNGLADGYYLVTSSVGSDLILDTIGDTTVYSKNAYPTLEKKVDEGKESTTADKGEELPFTIDVTIPEDAVGAIVVHDKMTGLTYQSMTAVDGITANTTSLTDECAVEFTLTDNYVAANKGTTVTIAYTAKVTADVANNDAWLVDDTFTSKKDSTEVLSTDIVITKVDKTTKESLKGAEFVLKNAEGKFYAVDIDGNVSWVAAQENATVVTTDDNGAAKFENIADGTYNLVETAAPSGYNLLTAPVEVKVAAVESEGKVVDITPTVENSTGSELPSTGGIGTTLFYVIGGLLMTGAVVLLITKRRVA